MSNVFTTTKVDVSVGNSEITIEQGRVALQASGAVLIKSGETVVMVTAVTQGMDREPDFFPLTCNYQGPTTWITTPP